MFLNLRTQLSTGSNPKSERFNSRTQIFIGGYVFCFLYILFFDINSLLYLFFIINYNLNCNQKNHDFKMFILDLKKIEIFCTDLQLECKIRVSTNLKTHIFSPINLINFSINMLHAISSFIHNSQINQFS